MKEDILMLNHLNELVSNDIPTLYLYKTIRKPINCVIWHEYYCWIIQMIKLQIIHARDWNYLLIHDNFLLAPASI